MRSTLPNKIRVLHEVLTYFQSFFLVYVDSTEHINPFRFMDLRDKLMTLLNCKINGEVFDIYSWFSDFEEKLNEQIYAFFVNYYIHLKLPELIRLLNELQQSNIIISLDDLKRRLITYIKQFKIIRDREDARLVWKALNDFLKELLTFQKILQGELLS